MAIYYLNLPLYARSLLRSRTKLSWNAGRIRADTARLGWSKRESVSICRCIARYCFAASGKTLTTTAVMSSNWELWPRKSQTAW